MSMSKVDSYVNAYSNNDGVQQYGGTDGHVGYARTSGVSAARVDPQATQNIGASTVSIDTFGLWGTPTGQRSANVGHFMGPATIHGPEVWGQLVVPNLHRAER